MLMHVVFTVQSSMSSLPLQVTDRPLLPSGHAPCCLGIFSESLDRDKQYLIFRKKYWYKTIKLFQKQLSFHAFY